MVGFRHVTVLLGMGGLIGCAYVAPRAAPADVARVIHRTADHGRIVPPWSGLPTRTVANPTKRVFGDPVNIAFEGTRASILKAFAHIGWVRADPLSIRDDVHLAYATIDRRLYPTAPVSNLYLFGRPEDFAVEHELGSVARRDHARVWDTGRKDTGAGLELYIGDASRDAAIEIVRSKHRHLPIGTTHRIAPNLDAERDLIVGLLRRAHVVSTMIMEAGIGRTTDGRNGTGDRYYTDGKSALIVLKGG